MSRFFTLCLFFLFVLSCFLLVLRLESSIVRLPGPGGSGSNIFFDVPVDTSRTVYAYPAIPAIPAGGGYTRDPLFSTLILRVSADADSDNGAGCTSAYSYWPSVNLDSTRIQAKCSNTAGDIPTLWTLNPTTFTISNKRNLFGLCSGISPRGEDAIWSGSASSLIFAVQGANLYSCDVDTGTVTLVHNFAGDLSAGGYLWQLSKSIDDNVFAGTMRDSSDNPTGFIVWKRSTNTNLMKQLTTPLDEVQIDKTGLYLVWKPGVFPPTNDPYSYACVTATAVCTAMLYNSTQGPPGHSDNGTGTLLGYDNWNNCWDLRSYLTPGTKTFALCKGPTGTPGDFSGPGYDGAHISYLADNEGWAVTSDEMPTTTPASFFLTGEIDQISTDGSQSVRHVAHSFSVSDHVVYNDYPRANISRDGKFITYTSNWGRGVGGRVDVFVVAIKAAP